MDKNINEIYNDLDIENRMIVKWIGKYIEPKKEMIPNKYIENKQIGRKMNKYGKNRIIKDEEEFEKFEKFEEYEVWDEMSDKMKDEEVEYNMDFEDISWLNEYNRLKRIKMKILPISRIIFEFVIDRLEKGWYKMMCEMYKCALTSGEEIKLMISNIDQKLKNNFKDGIVEGIDESSCNICGAEEAYSHNMIVYCDVCNIGVHQECYGVPYIPKFAWICERCLLEADNETTCIFCPMRGGALKQTEDDRWAHIVCALWIPGVRVEGSQKQINFGKRVSALFNRYICEICKDRSGIPVKCGYKKCHKLFHVSCAINSKMYADSSNYVIFCDKHNPKFSYKYMNAIMKIFKKKPQQRKFVKLLSHKTTFGMRIRGVVPVSPQVLLDRIYLRELKKIQVAKKFRFLVDVARYWSLKKEANYNSPLISGLQVENLFSSYNETLRIASSKDSLRFKETIPLVISDLVKVCDLVKLIHTRESKILQSLLVVEKIIHIIKNPIKSQIFLLLNHFRSCTKGFFENLINTKTKSCRSSTTRQVSYSLIESYIQTKSYNLYNFYDDISLIYKNSLRNNSRTSEPYKNALILKHELTKLKKRISSEQEIISKTYSFSLIIFKNLSKT